MGCFTPVFYQLCLCDPCSSWRKDTNGPWRFSSKPTVTVIFMLVWCPFFANMINKQDTPIRIDKMAADWGKTSATNKKKTMNIINFVNDIPLLCYVSFTAKQTSHIHVIKTTIWKALTCHLPSRWKVKFKSGTSLGSIVNEQGADEQIWKRKAPSALLQNLHNCKPDTICKPYMCQQVELGVWGVCVRGALVTTLESSQIKLANEKGCWWCWHLEGRCQEQECLLCFQICYV